MSGTLGVLRVGDGALAEARLVEARLVEVSQPRERYQRSRCTTSLNGRRSGWRISVSGRSAG